MSESKTGNMPVTLLNFDNVSVRFALFTTSSNQDDKRYVVSSEPIDTIDRIERWPKLDTQSVEFHEEDSDGKFFAFANVDCMSPPVAIIRARTFESAYEVFCDEFTKWLKIDESDLKDYDVESDSPKCSFNSNGQPIDTENVRGFTVKLASIEC